MWQLTDDAAFVASLRDGCLWVPQLRLGPMVVPVLDGSVTADRTAAVRWSAQVRVPPETVGSNLLDPTANPVLPWGVVASRAELTVTVNQQWTMPLLIGAVMGARVVWSASGERQVEVHLADVGQLVAQARWERPVQLAAGLALRDVLTMLLASRAPGVPIEVDVGDWTLPRARVLGDQVDNDPWADIQALARAGGAQAWATRDGILTVRRAAPDATAVRTWRTGPGGQIVAAELEVTRERVYNGVVVIYNRGRDRLLVVDDDPASPTVWGGPFGRKPRFWQSSLLRTADEAHRAGQTILESARRAPVQATLAVTPDPTLDPGDVVDVTLADMTWPLRIDTIEWPLSGGAMQIQAQLVRRLVIGGTG